MPEGRSAGKDWQLGAPRSTKLTPLPGLMPRIDLASRPTFFANTAIDAPQLLQGDRPEVTAVVAARTLAVADHLVGPKSPTAMPDRDASCHRLGQRRRHPPA